MGKRGDMGGSVEWISGPEAAKIMGVHRNTVYLSLKNEALRARTWGREGEGWRHKPLSTRGIFEVSKQRARELAQPPNDQPPPPSP